jgi:WXXGXW repeat (2 copies)
MTKQRLMSMSGVFVIVLISAGCAENREIRRVPVYRGAAVYQPVYPVAVYPPQTAYPTTPPPAVQQVPVVNEAINAAPPAPVAPAAPVATPATPPPVIAPAAPAPALIVQQPPAPQVEVIPAPPGPEYYWVPGYWNWQGRWVWVSGVYVHRPHPHAVWVNGYWAHRRGGYVWMRGHWR